MRRNLFITLSTLLFIVGVAATLHLRAQHKSEPQQPHTDCPMMKQHGKVGVNERGDQGMGFSQEKTTHHFYLKKTGGVIEVEANDAKDTVSKDQIRQHLGHIARMFTEGNFDTPMFVHDQVPPGVTDMQRLKSAISYKYEKTERGGRVLIYTDDAQAVAAVQSFLRFQITDHKTGDPLEVK